VTMLFAIILEPKTFELSSECENKFWSEDSAGVEARQKIGIKSKKFLIINFVFLGICLILSVAMCPIFGDHKEWILISIIFENNFGTWGNILDWIYLSTMPFVLFSSIRLGGALFYTTLALHVQMLLINEHILQISENCENSSDQAIFHTRISQKLRFCIDHHVCIKR
jgi:hypothetical protein